MATVLWPAGFRLSSWVADHCEKLEGDGNRDPTSPHKRLPLSAEGTSWSWQQVLELHLLWPAPVPRQQWLPQTRSPNDWPR
eukprot:4305489-Amphidinium_carterae.1